ncbi:MAG: transketolase, partial [Rickettsiaceae bacterium]|nr:transketolase [Rickettsiaceae bacterium]
VGIAIAQKKYQDFVGSLMEYKIYCICGDGCLMEGISSEAASLAGNLGLNNLIVLYDDNEITIDGSAKLSCSDDYAKKFESMGWATLEVDGHDFEEIEKALTSAQKSDKPFFISFKTKIGYKSGEKESSSLSHGAPLGPKSLKQLRENLDWQQTPLFVPDIILDEWREISNRHRNEYEDWLEDFTKLSREKKLYLNPPDSENLIDKISSYTSVPTTNTATREASGKFIEILMRFSNKIIAGSADLGGSTYVFGSYSQAITRDDFSGNYIHFGIRENAMAAIMNGLATQAFLPIGSSFLAFSDYMRPSIRLSSIMKLPVIFVMTHDSIGVGEDGPTHQPIEHLASLRAMPNLRVFRPADTLETQEIYKFILKDKMPALIALSRQKLSNFQVKNRQYKVARGAYIFSSNEDEKVEVSIWATGSELEIAVEVKYLLTSAGISSRIISCPNIELFLSQEEEYKAKLIDRKQEYSKLHCAIEAGSRFGWERIIGENGLFFGINSYGESGPSQDLYKFFNLTPSFITNKILEKLQEKEE